MKTIYLMRHGQTLFNVMDVNQGQCDSPLTELGIQQARTAKDWYREHHVYFDSVYSSSAERACDTTELVAPGYAYQRRKNLKEILLGTKEATPNSENPPFPYGDYFVKFGGEDLDAFTERVYEAIRDIAEEENGESVLIVTHGTVIRRFLYKLGQTAAEGIGDAFIGNCGIVKLGYENGSFFIEEIINPNKE